MKIIQFFVWLAILGVALYLMGALAIDKGKITITTSVIKEKSEKAYEIVKNSGILDSESINSTINTTKDALNKVKSEIINNIK